jgi:hypothetical protein
METHSLTALSAGSASAFAFAAGNNLLIKLVSISHDDLIEAERAIGVTGRGSIRRPDRSCIGIECVGTVRSRIVRSTPLSREQRSTPADLSLGGFAGTT